MAQDFRNSLVRTIGTGDTTILTAGDYDAVIGIRCCNILTSTMSEVELQKLLKILLEKESAKNISFEDLPVDDSMRSYFENPDKYIK